MLMKLTAARQLLRINSSDETLMLTCCLQSRYYFHSAMTLTITRDVTSKKELGDKLECENTKVNFHIQCGYHSSF